LKQAISYLEIAVAYAVIAIQTRCFDLNAVQVGFVVEKVTSLSPWFSPVNL
jgi:hypothetical protein